MILRHSTLARQLHLVHVSVGQPQLRQPDGDERQNHGCRLVVEGALLDK